MSSASPDTLRGIGDLRSAGLLGGRDGRALEAVAERYAVAVTPAMADLIDPHDPRDPIARQFIPDDRELAVLPEELPDPIGDGAHSPVEGIVHRYPDRVLLKAVAVCAVYCRFCFRREMVGPGHARGMTPAALAAAMAYIAAHPEIWEVVVTGGDPFVLAPRRLAELVGALSDIPHVKILRFHTRVPAVAPERVTAELVEVLRSSRLTTYVALHANHPRELTPAARSACARMVDAGIPMLSQTVLLRGVNDNPETLAALMRGFVEMRVKPYYLHHADLAPGTAHFRTTIAQGQALAQALQGRVSGLCQPTYVLDLPGGYGKAPVGPAYATESDALGQRSVRDFRGAWHPYADRLAADPQETS